MIYTSNISNIMAKGFILAYYKELINKQSEKKDQEDH